MGDVQARRKARGVIVALAAAGLMGASLIGGAAPATATVSAISQIQPPPTPNLSGPGYAVEEYLVSGTASAYERVGTWSTDGHWGAKPSTTADYRTRVLVRRPTSAARFNGTVIVEWLNVSAGFDSSPYYIETHDELLRDGYAWVGVSAQHIGVDAPGGLKNSDPARYGTLVHPGDSYSYDIFSDVARQLRSPGAQDLLSGLRPTRFIAAGQSQSAARLGTYINAVQPLAKMFDGFAVQDRTQNLSALFDGDTGVPTSALLRTDLPQPIMEIQDEGDFVALRSHLARQDDAAGLRVWEVAGAAHADEYTLSPSVPTPATKAGSPCTARANSAAYHVVVSASLVALDKWIQGTPPPSAPRLELTDPAAADPIARDGLGIGKGGIRLPEMDAPAALIDGRTDGVPPGAPAVFVSFCRLFGRTIPFPEATLAALYPDHESYVRAFDASAARLVNAGFGLRADVLAIRAVAAASDIGKVGWFVAGSAGDVAAFGAASVHGTLTGVRLNKPIVGIDSSPGGGGYRMVAADGGVFAFGDASFRGSAAPLRLKTAIVGIAGTATGNGYWLVAADGGVLTYGDAPFLGSLGGAPRPSPIVSMAATPSGGGYWLVARDGTVTGFGDAIAVGSATKGASVVAIESTPTGIGYWVTRSDGTVQSFGDAVAPKAPSASGTIGIAVDTSGQGYRLATSSGAVRGAGDAINPSTVAHLARGQRAVAITAMG